VKIDILAGMRWSHFDVIFGIQLISAFETLFENTKEEVCLAVDSQT